MPSSWMSTASLVKRLSSRKRICSSSRLQQYQQQPCIFAKKQHADDQHALCRLGDLVLGQQLDHVLVDWTTFRLLLFVDEQSLARLAAYKTTVLVEARTNPRKEHE